MGCGNLGNLPVFNLFIYFQTVQVSPSPPPALKWKFVVFYSILFERDIFSVLARQKKEEEHCFCERRNICQKAERQEVTGLLLLLDLNKTARKIGITILRNNC